MAIKQELIDSIYDGIVESPPWSSFLHQLRLEFGSPVISMWIRSPLLERQKRPLSDMEPEYEGLVEPFIEQYHSETVLLRRPMAHGEVTLLMAAIGEDAYRQSAIFRELYEGFGMGDGLIYHLEEPGGLQAWLAAGRKETSPPFSESEKKYCEALTPHLTRALGLYSRLNKAEVEADVYAEVVEQLTVGILTLDRKGKVLKISRVAKDLLAATTTIDIKSDCLHFSHSADQKSFRVSFEEILDLFDQEAWPGGVDLMTVQQDSGNDLGLLLKCAPYKPWYEGVIPPGSS